MSSSDVTLYLLVGTAYLAQFGYECSFSEIKYCYLYVGSAYIISVIEHFFM